MIYFPEVLAGGCRPTMNPALSSSLSILTDLGPWGKNRVLLGLFLPKGNIDMK